MYPICWGPIRLRPTPESSYARAIRRTPPDAPDDTPRRLRHIPRFRHRSSHHVPVRVSSLPGRRTTRRRPARIQCGRSRMAAIPAPALIPVRRQDTHHHEAAKNRRRDERVYSADQHPRRDGPLDVMKCIAQLLFQSRLDSTRPSLEQLHGVWLPPAYICSPTCFPYCCNTANRLTE